MNIPDYVDVPESGKPTKICVKCHQPIQPTEEYESQYNSRPAVMDYMYWHKICPKPNQE